MNFTTDIVIKGDAARKFQELKQKYSFDYIDSYLYSATLSINEKGAEDSGISDNTSPNQEAEINIPRNVLMSRGDIIDLVSTVIVLASSSGESSDEVLQNAFEETSDDAKTTFRYKRLHEHALKGIHILYNNMLNGEKIGVIEYISQVLENLE